MSQEPTQFFKIPYKLGLIIIHILSIVTLQDKVVIIRNERYAALSLSSV